MLPGGEVIVGHWSKQTFLLRRSRWATEEDIWVHHGVQVRF